MIDFYVLQNPEDWTDEDDEEAKQLSKKVEKLEDNEYGFRVPSSSGGKPHTVMVKGKKKPAGNLPKKQKCKHIVAVEHKMGHNVYANSIYAADPKKPDKLLIGHCDCKAFQYTMSEGGQSSSSSTQVQEVEETPVEIAGEIDERFKDLPAFGVMKYQGKRYIKKAGLQMGFNKAYPEGVIETNVLKVGPKYAAVRAVAENGEGVLGTGMGSAKKSNCHTRLLEMAETRAVNRAIRHVFGLPVSGEEVKE